MLLTIFLLIFMYSLYTLLLYTNQKAFEMYIIPCSTALLSDNDEIEIDPQEGTRNGWSDWLADPYHIVMTELHIYYNSLNYTIFKVSTKKKEIDICSTTKLVSHMCSVYWLLFTHKVTQWFYLENNSPIYTSNSQPSRYPFKLFVFFFLELSTAN